MKALLVTYRAEGRMFDSTYQRNQFYRGLFGYRQTVKRNGKRYKYDKDGIADLSGVTRVDDSALLFVKGRREEILDYMQDWPQVSHHVFKVEVEDKQLRRQLKDD